MSYIVVCDYDGTITNIDVLAHLFDKYVGREKRLHLESTLSPADQIQKCLEEVPYNIIESILSGNLPSPIMVDTNFELFSKIMFENGVSLFVLSGGLKQFIIPQLRYITLENIFANELDYDHNTGIFKVIQLVKKSEILDKLRSKYNVPIIYFGDGRSDFEVCGHVDIIYAKEESEFAEYCERQGIQHGTFRTFLEAYQELQKRDVHIHFGFGKIVCGILLKQFLEVLSKDKCILFLRKCNVAKTNRVIVDGITIDVPKVTSLTELTKNGKGITDIRNVEFLIMKMKIIGCKLTVSTSVGMHNFADVYSIIRKYLGPDQEVHAFENFLLNSIDSVYTGIVRCIADRICTSMTITNTYEQCTIIVHTEPYNGKVYVPLSSSLINIATSSDIMVYGILKSYLLNFLHCLLALYADDEVFNMSVIFKCNERLILRWAIVALTYVCKTHKVQLNVAKSFLKQSIERLRSDCIDYKSRILKNLDTKYKSIIFPILKNLIYLKYIK
jgi:HAD superfamily phosphoserine phosphatase-like hydrolase